MTALSIRAPVRRATALSLPIFLVASAVAHASDATGVWINDTGRGAIEIKPCGDNLCGHVIWLKDSSDAKGCGRQIIGDAQPVNASTWDNGWIYSPEKKKRYDVELKPLDKNRLRVTGYAGSKFFSKTMIWKRAPADIERCGTSSAEAQNPVKNTTADVASSETANVAAKPTDQAQVETYASTNEPRLSPESRLRAEMAKEAEALKPKTTVDHATKVAEADEPTEAAKADGLDLGGLNINKYLKKNGGSCELDLPWVKVDFKCPE